MTTPQHAFKPGNRVQVFNANLYGFKITEGFATIVRRVEALDHTYMVKFESDDDNDIYERFVRPDQAA